MPDTKTSGETEIFELPEIYFFNIAQTDTANFKISVRNIFNRTDTPAILEFDANHITSADGDVIGRIDFLDETTVSPAEQNFGQIRVLIQDPSNASFEGEMFLSVAFGATMVDYISLNNAGGDDVSIHKNLDLLGNNLTLGASDPKIIWETGESIGMEGGNRMVFDIPNASIDRFTFDIAGVSKLEVSNTTIDFMDNSLQCGNNSRVIRFGTNQSIGIEGTKFVHDCSTSESFTWEVFTTEVMEVSDTGLDLKGLQLVLGSTANVILFGAGESIGMEANDMIFDVTDTNLFFFAIDGTNEYSFSATAFSVSTNAITFLNSNVSILGTASLVYDVASGSSHVLRIDNVAELLIDGSAVTLATNNLILTTGFLQFSDVNTTITDVAGILRYDVASTFSHEFRINDVIEMTLNDTIMNLPTASFQEVGVNISPIGLHDIYIDAGGVIPVDAGDLATRIVDGGVDQKAFAYIPFANGAVSFATVKLVLPRTYNLGTITAVIEWTSETEGSGTVEWDISACAVGEGENMSTVVFGTPITVSDTQTTINFVQTTSRTANITIGNTPVDGNVIFLKIQRDGVSDTFGQDAQLLGIWIDITTDQAVSS